MAVWVEESVSWEFGKLPKHWVRVFLVIDSWCWESGWEFSSGRKFSQEARPRECSILDVFGLLFGCKTMING